MNGNSREFAILRVRIGCAKPTEAASRTKRVPQMPGSAEAAQSSFLGGPSLEIYITKIMPRNEIEWADQEPQTNANHACVCATPSRPVCAQIWQAGNSVDA